MQWARLRSEPKPPKSLIRGLFRRVGTHEHSQNRPNPLVLEVRVHSAEQTSGALPTELTGHQRSNPADCYI